MATVTGQLYLLHRDRESGEGAGGGLKSSTVLLRQVLRMTTNRRSIIIPILQTQTLESGEGAQLAPLSRPGLNCNYSTCTWL